MSFIKNKYILALISGILLGMSYPPFPTGMFAFIAFVPFFMLFEDVEDYARGFRYALVMLFIYNLITLYWTGGFTHGKDIYLMLAGGLLLLAHPFFFLIPVAGWMFFRKYFGFKQSLMVFPFLWVAFEYLHSLSEVSFPWNTLGITQTYDLSFIQFISFTGVYGLSFLILWINVLIYYLVSTLRTDHVKVVSFRSLSLIAFIILLFLIPRIYGWNLLHRQSGSVENEVRIGIVQPNIDPFEKWQGNAIRQITLIQSLTDSFAYHPVDLVLWPETAVPFYLLEPSNKLYFDRIQHQVDVLNINLLSGFPDIVYYRSNESIPKSSKQAVNGDRYDNFNSSLLLQPHSNEIQKYSKMVLVPFAERVPFSEQLSFLNAMQWNFGLGGWALGKDTTVFHFVTASGVPVKFSNMICYESVYPSLVSSFVRKGAEFLTVITNDSWWGNTSGPYQHRQIAILRAVENRRWIVQCANGGISCTIDPFGSLVMEQPMFVQTVAATSVERKSELTFYTEHGDWLAELCTMLSVFFVVGAIGSKMYVRIRKIQTDERPS